MRKITIYLLVIAFFISPVLAQQFGGGSGFNNLGSLLGDVFRNISTLYMMDWVEGNTIGFARFLLWILVFSIFHFVGIRVFQSKETSAFSGKKLSLIVSLVIATSTILFIPNSMIESLFRSQATLVMFIPVGFILYFIYSKKAKDWFPGAMLHFVRLIGLFISSAIITLISVAVI